jgi:hypothetical protein
MTSIEVPANEADRPITITSDDPIEERPGYDAQSSCVSALLATGTSSSDLDHPQSRVCVVCGSDLAGRRKDAVVCGGPCRAERSRLRAILKGSRLGPYLSISHRIQASHRRTQAFIAPFPYGGQDGSGD